MAAGRFPPEGLGVEPGVMRQHAVQSVLQHQQTAVRLLLHGEQQADASVQRRCGNTDKEETVYLTLRLLSQSFVCRITTENCNVCRARMWVFKVHFQTFSAPYSCGKLHFIYSTYCQ